MKKRWIILSVVLFVLLAVALPSLFIIHYVYYTPISLQREMIGRSLVNATSLSHFDFFEHSHEWIYNLRPAEKANVKRYCLLPDQFSGYKRDFIRSIQDDGCAIAIRNGKDGNLVSIDLVRDDLIVRKFNEPGMEFIPESKHQVR